jgi:hypothetical protein
MLNKLMGNCFSNDVEVRLCRVGDNSRFGHHNRRVIIDEDNGAVLVRKVLWYWPITSLLVGVGGSPNFLLRLTETIATNPVRIKWASGGENSPPLGGHQTLPAHPMQWICKVLKRVRQETSIFVGCHLFA